MQQRFLSNLLLLLALNLLVKPLYILGIDAEVQSRVGAEVYGTYFSLINLSFLLNFLLDFGITNYNVRKVARQGNLITEQFSGLLTLRLLLAAAYMLALMLLGFFLGYTSYQLTILAVLGFNQVLAAYLLFFRSNLSGLHLFKQDSFISILDRALLILLVGALLIIPTTGGSFQIEWFVYAQTFTYGVAALMAFFLVKRKLKEIKIDWDPEFWKRTMIASSPYALLTLVMMAYHRSDGVMLERMLDDNGSEAGIYARGYRFFEAASMIAYLFAVLLLPMFSRAIERKENITRLVNVSFRILFTGAWTLGLLCYVFSDEVLALRYSDLLAETSPVFALLMMGFVAYSTTYVFGTLITAKGDMKLLNLISIFGVALNISLNFFLIPEHGAYGSAVATLITQLLAAVVQFIASVVIFKLRFNFKVVLGTLVFAGLSWIIADSCTIFGEDWQFQMVGVLFSTLILAGISGLIPVRAFMEMLRDRVIR